MSLRLRVTFHIAALLLFTQQVAAQTTYLMCSATTPCRIWYGAAITNSSGQWSVSFPAGTFTTTPQVLPQALSADATIANSARASLTAQSTTAASGVVTIPAAVVVGGMPIKAAGAGLTVDVVAVGY